MTKPIDPADFCDAAPADVLASATAPATAVAKPPARRRTRTPAAPRSLWDSFEPCGDWKHCYGWSAARQRMFIRALAETGSISEAAATAGVSVRSAYRLRLRPGAEDFRRAWSLAQQAAVETLTAIAMERAIVGSPRGVWHAGKKVGDERVPNDRLLMFLLRHLDPGRFGNLARLQSIDVPDPVGEAQEDLDALDASFADHWPGRHADRHEDFASLGEAEQQD